MAESCGERGEGVRRRGGGKQGGGGGMDKDIMGSGGRGGGMKPLMKTLPPQN